MSMNLPPLKHERLLELLNYDPLTGIFTWRSNRYAGEYHTKLNVSAGDVAGNLTSGYVQIRIDRKLYGAHQLAWFYMTADWPPMVDHKNTDGLDNRFINLRLCDKSKNGANRGVPLNNTSGVKGVYWDARREKWAVEITHQNRRYHLGRFDTLEAAAAAYAVKSLELFGEFSRTA